jgi:predicted secreted hydrolase
MQGDAGYSRKGTCDTCASHYYSIPRIAITGQLRKDGDVVPLTGIAWMDHEFMSNTLAPDQVGWDWLGLMLKDGRNVTVFRLRAADGSTSYASATIQSGGRSSVARGDEVKLTPGNEWRSPLSGARYPLAWRIQIPSHEIDLTVRARVQSCEVGEGGSGLEPRYWEGPVVAEDESALGYLEMTGYAQRVTL